MVPGALRTHNPHLPAHSGVLYRTLVWPFGGQPTEFITKGLLLGEEPNWWQHERWYLLFAAWNDRRSTCQACRAVLQRLQSEVSPNMDFHNFVYTRTYYRSWPSVSLTKFFVAYSLILLAFEFLASKKSILALCTHSLTPAAWLPSVIHTWMGELRTKGTQQQKYNPL